MIEHKRYEERELADGRLLCLNEFENPWNGRCALRKVCLMSPEDVIERDGGRSGSYKSRTTVWQAELTYHEWSGILERVSVTAKGNAMVVEVTELANPGTEDRGREWLMREILLSMPQEILEAAKLQGSVNVQMMIDNVVCEPHMLSDMLLNTEKYIDREAQAKAEAIVGERLAEIEQKFQEMMEPLEESVRGAADKIKQEFNIPQENG